MPSGAQRAGRRLTSVISLAAHFFFLVLIITAGALHLLLHLFQLIQVNPSDQLEVPAYLKKTQTDRGVMNHNRMGFSLRGKSFLTSFSHGPGPRTPVPKRSCSSRGLSQSCICLLLPRSFFTCQQGTFLTQFSQKIWPRFSTVSRKSEVS